MKLLLLSLALLGCSSAFIVKRDVSAIEKREAELANDSYDCNFCDQNGCRKVPCSGKREVDDRESIIESDTSVDKREAEGENGLGPIPRPGSHCVCNEHTGKCYICSNYGVCQYEVPRCPFIPGVCVRCDKPNQCYEVPCHKVDGRNDFSSSAVGVNGPAKPEWTCTCYKGHCKKCSKWGLCHVVRECPRPEHFVPGVCWYCETPGHCYATDCHGHPIDKREAELANDSNDCNFCDQNGCRKVPCSGKREVRSAEQQRCGFDCNSIFGCTWRPCWSGQGAPGKREVEDRDPIIESDTSVDSESSIDLEKREAGEEEEAEINHNSVSSTNCICIHGRCTGC